MTSEKDRADDKFKEEMLEVLGRDRVTFCFQCGRCTASCPSARFSTNYNPRRLILRAIIGMRQELLDNPDLWQCASCNSCEEVCDHGVHIVQALSRMKNMAAREGKMPKAYKQSAGLLVKCGMLANLSAAERLRAQVGLGPVKGPSEKTVEEIRKILEKTGFLDLVGGDGK